MAAPFDERRAASSVSVLKTFSTLNMIGPAAPPNILSTASPSQSGLLGVDHGTDGLYLSGMLDGTLQWVLLGCAPIGNPVFKASLSASTVFNSGSGAFPIPFDVTVRNTAPAKLALAGGGTVINILTAGRYRIKYNVHVSGMVFGDHVTAVVRVNGPINLSRTEAVLSSALLLAFPQVLASTVVLNLVAGQTVEIVVSTTQALNVTINDITTIAASTIAEATSVSIDEIC